MITTDVLGWPHETSVDQIIKLDTHGTRLLVPFEFGPRQGYNYVLNGKVRHSVIGTITKVLMIRNMGIVVVQTDGHLYSYSCEGKNIGLCKVVNTFADNEFLISDKAGNSLAPNMFQISKENQLVFVDRRVRTAVELFGVIAVITESSVFCYRKQQKRTTFLDITPNDDWKD